MILVYGKGKVGSAVASLCEYFQKPYEIRDDSDNLTSYEQYNAIIPSPGVPSHHPIYSTGKVISELDFAYQFLPENFQTIGITGTDGKSTTTWMLYSILEKEYFGKESVYISGNFDVPFSETVLQILKKGGQIGIIVIEISSFMAYSLEKFRPDYAIFTNFKPDHLNWHKNLQDYLDSKMHLMRNTKKRAIMNRQIIEFAKENNLKINPPVNTRLFQNGKSKTENGKLQDYIDGENIIVSGRHEYKLSETPLSGSHNALNILASTLVTDELKLPSNRTKTYLQSLSSLPHRLELVGEKGGIRFIDDSKSTSSQSLEAALSSFQKEKIILIAGGSDKGDRFEGLEDSLKGIKYATLIGATRAILGVKCDSAKIKYSFAEDMDEAVQSVYSHAKKGDIILLSPGCASFGLFRDYLDRATKFREAYNKIPD